MNDNFYITGGTLPQDASSYVTRRADVELFDSLRHGDFCYVLNTRQMGKSSLMVRAANRLKAEGCRVAILDLTAVGKNLSVEQWYFGLLIRVATQVGSRDDLQSFWKNNRELGPMQRFVEGLRRLLTEGTRNQELGIREERPPILSPLVLFVDEIDAVLSLPFSADEFFAGIRECYNRRAQEPVFARLTFCLLGVATPADLIRDVRTTPFNIGKRIELRDFTPEEAAPLAQGLGERKNEKGDSLDTGTFSFPFSSVSCASLLKRVLYWTNGHPYMTQRLCREIAEQQAQGVVTTADIDRICERLFLSKAAQESDDNLAFVRNRLLKSEADLSTLLDLYAQVWAGRKVRDDETNPLCAILRLSGAVAVNSGVLRVRNRIYDHVFNKQWVREHMPDAEVQRQKRAYRLGLMRATAGATLIIALMGILSAYAFLQRNRANQNALEAAANLRVANQEKQLAIESVVALQSSERNKSEALTAAQKAKNEADKQTRNAQEATNRERGQRQSAVRSAQAANIARHAESKAKIAAQRSAEEANRNLYVADMALIQREWENNNIVHVQELLQQTRKRGRGMFEWGYWNRQGHNELLTLKGHTGWVYGVGFSPDGKRIVTGSMDKTAKVWDAGSGHELLTLKGHTQDVKSVAYSPDGKRIVTGSFDSTAKVWDAQTGKEILTLKGRAGRVSYVAFSPDSKRIATAGAGITARTENAANRSAIVWDAATGKELLTLRVHSQEVSSIAFSPDGKRIATNDQDHAATVWDSHTGQELLTLKGHGAPIDSVAFDWDSSYIVTGSADNTARVWDAGSGKELHIFDGHTQEITSVAILNQVLATGSADTTAKVWTGINKEVTLRGHTGPISSVAFSPDGKRLVTGSMDKTAKVWDIQNSRDIQNSQEGLTLKDRDSVSSAAFSPDGKQIALGGGGTASILDPATGKELLVLTGLENCRSVAFSPDGKRLATTGWGHTAKAWDTRLWDLNTRKVLLTFKGSISDLDSCAFSPDGKRIITTSADKTATVWDTQTGKEILTIKGHFASVAFSPDGKRIVTVSGDNIPKVWNAQSGKELLTLKKLPGDVRSIAFSPDGKRIVTGYGGRIFTDNNVAKVRDAVTGKELLTLKGHVACVSSVAYSHDGKRIVTSSWDHSLKVWDARSGQELCTVKEHPGGTYLVAFTGRSNFVAFSPDDKRIVTGGYNAPTRVLSADLRHNASSP